MTLLPADDSKLTTAETQDQTAATSLSDLSLTEFLSQLLRHPRQTWQALNGALQAIPRPAPKADPELRQARALSQIAAEQTAQSDPGVVVAPAIFTNPPTQVVISEPVVVERPSTIHLIGTYALPVFVAIGVIFIIALIGQTGLSNSVTIPIDQSPLIVPGILLIMAGIGFGALVWTQVRFDRLEPLTYERPNAAVKWNAESLVRRFGARALLFGLGLFNVMLAWTANTASQFTTTGMIYWILSIVAITGACYDKIPEAWAQIQSIPNKVLGLFHSALRLRLTPTLIAMIIILIVGAYFRFSNLDAYPPDMTSDHVEKVRDSFYISQGQIAGGPGWRPIFLDNNGGREPAYFYFVALLQGTTGIRWGFDLIKIASGIWGMVMILVALWMGRAIIGEEDRNLGNLTGVLMAALISVSYWHTMLSRLGLRIVTTTVVAGLLLIFLTRALRHNRRGDWLIAGLILGGGLYFYQAVRMLPVVVLAGVALALLLRARSRHDFAAYTLNFVALVLVALAVFAPLGRYMLEYPQSFWSRSSGRLFGEDTIEIKDDKGNVVGSRLAGNQDRIEAFTRNLPVLGSNMLKSIWMFNWQGDRAWITGSPEGEPELDTFTGIWFALGLGLMAVRIARRRDPSDWLIPLSVVILVLPTALSIAFVIEVPSATRASGAFPFVYFIAAFGLAMALRLLSGLTNSRLLRQALVALTTIAILLGGMANWNTYFVVAMKYYRDSTLPHHIAGEILRSFSESVGSSGNAFMVNYPYWMDDRAIAIEAGDPRWHGGVLETELRQRLIDMIRANVGTPYEFRPDRQLLFFLHQNAQDSLATLVEMFPAGYVTPIETYAPSRDFMTYTVQPVGCGWIGQNIGMSTVCDEAAAATDSQ
ncbi:MAG: hypothetical protein KF726_12330 [Anaerolineae bacterium]|nr:hypothetical protein [Anaerolineae bacterium]